MEFGIQQTNGRSGALTTGEYKVKPTSSVSAKLHPLEQSK